MTGTAGSLTRPCWWRLCRSGLVVIGDRVLAVDDVNTSDKSAAEVSSLISSNRTSHIRLQLLSASAARLQRQRRRATSDGQLLISQSINNWSYSFVVVQTICSHFNLYTLLFAILSWGFSFRTYHGFNFSTLHLWVYHRIFVFPVPVWILRECRVVTRYNKIRTGMGTMNILRYTHSFPVKSWSHDKFLMRNPMTELQGATCHMGSHNVTCHSTQANTPALTPDLLYVAEYCEMWMMEMRYSCVTNIEVC